MDKKRHVYWTALSLPAQLNCSRDCTKIFHGSVGASQRKKKVHFISYKRLRK